MSPINFNSKLQEAVLNQLTQPLMCCDVDGRIIYLNKSAQNLFQRHAATIRESIPEFNASSLAGSNISVLTSKLEKVDSERSTHSSEQLLRIADLTLKAVLTPIKNESGAAIGLIVEWNDQSEQSALQVEIQSVLAGIAEGDLTKRVESDCDGFLGNLKRSTNQTAVKLIDVVQQIKDVSDSVANGSVEICQGNTNLSQHTEEQASSLEETSSSMEQMTSTVQQNADNAGQADTLAKGAKAKAEHGGEVVGKAIDVMAEINGASKRIADIISVINEIAFQTNLLALNASVEAARAGDQGRGFAVVASEVRNLAGRSTTAAKEIKELIEDSVEKVEQGSRLVDDSGKTLEEINNEVQKVTEIVGEISAASLEQAAGIEQVSKAIGMMDEMTQQNAALVQQAAAASEAMGEQAAELKDQMSFFKLGNDKTTNPPVANDLPEEAQPRPDLLPEEDSAQEEYPIPAPWVFDKNTSRDWEEF